MGILGYRLTLVRSLSSLEHFFDQVLSEVNGATANATLPSNIAPGNYLIRHEIIALHLAVTLGGAEFYPSCSQLTVGGSGTGKPNDNELVSLPGAYSDNDPGIFDPTVFNPGANYTFPGPPIASFVGGSGSSDGGDDSGSGSGSGTATNPSPTSGSTSSSSSKCKLKKGPKPTASGDSSNSRRSGDGSLNVRHYPRHISRVMRSLAFGHSRH
jgi:hypothetical protein